MHHSSTFAELRRGIIEATPILIGVMPFGLILGTRFANRNGGYVRILKYGFRKGDNAPLALVQLTDLTAEDSNTEAA